MKRKEFIRRIRTIYLQVCIPKILKPAFGEGTSFPKLFFVNYNSSIGGFTRFNDIYLNIRAIRNSVNSKEQNEILGTAVYVLIHECTHQIQRQNLTEYSIDKKCLDTWRKRNDSEPLKLTLSSLNIYKKIFRKKYNIDYSKRSKFLTKET